jgi:molybdopterin-guanine dinucleotide biosynthesis protein B
MNAPKILAVVGYKNSGKTRVVEVLVKELTRRGYKIGTIKHTIDKMTLDTPGKDTWRHTEAGAVATAILSEGETAFFIKKRLEMTEVINRFGCIDYLILEGFKTWNNVARIIVPKTQMDIERLRNGLEIAIVVREDKEISSELPLVSIIDAAFLADLVEEKAFPLLPEMNCQSCGYYNCHDFARAIIENKISANECIGFAKNFFSVNVNGENLVIKEFVQKIFSNVINGLLMALKGIEEVEMVNISYNVKKDE